MKRQKGFTLLEFLVVVLIIGILAAVALPQYQRAKERTIMAKGIEIAKQVANANQVYYVLYGQYADDIFDLDIEFPGEKMLDNGSNRISAKHFLISTTGAGKNEVALVHRHTYGQTYYVYFLRTAPNVLRCASYPVATTVMKDLCAKLDRDGRL